METTHLIESKRTTCLLMQLRTGRYTNFLDANINAIKSANQFDQIILITTEKEPRIERNAALSKVVTTGDLEIAFPQLSNWWRTSMNSDLDENVMERYWIKTIDRFFYLYLYLLLNRNEIVFYVESDYYITPDFNARKIVNQIAGRSDKVFSTFGTKKNPTGILIATDFKPVYTILKNSIATPRLNDIELLWLLEGGIIFPICELLPKSAYFEENLLDQYSHEIDDPAAELRVTQLMERRCFTHVLSTEHQSTENLTAGRRAGRLTFELKGKEGVKQIWGIHVGSKSLVPWLVRAPQEDEIVTGERLQSKVDITIMTDSKFALLKDQKIKPKQIIVYPSKRSLTNSEALKINSSLESKKSIFIYGDEVLSFKELILPFIQNEINLVIHNSDATVNPADPIFRSIIDSGVVNQIYCQNLTTETPIFKSVPIGIANSRWEHGDIPKLISSATDHKKTNTVYANFSTTTNPSRIECLNVMRQLPMVTTVYKKTLNFASYITELASFKYAICPAGNGIDTHRFWEAIYVGTIPIILKSDFIPVYDGYPMIVLESWSDLANLPLEVEWLNFLTDKSYVRYPKLSDYKFNV